MTLSLPFWIGVVALVQLAGEFWRPPDVDLVREETLELKPAHQKN